MSAWGRRIRRVSRACLWLVSTVVLAAGLLAAALVCADALGLNGPLVLSVALAVTIVVLFATTGFGRLAIAAMCAFPAVAASYWLGLDVLVLLSALFERHATWFAVVYSPACSTVAKHESTTAIVPDLPWSRSALQPPSWRGKQTQSSR